MEITEISAFILNPANHWIVLGVGGFLLLDGIMLYLILVKNIFNTQAKTKSTRHFSKIIIITSALFSVFIGLALLISALI